MYSFPRWMNKVALYTKEIAADGNSQTEGDGKSHMETSCKWSGLHENCFCVL